MRRLLLVALVLTLATVAGVAACATATATTPSSTATPGGVRVIQNGNWVYWDELAEGEGFVEVSTEPGAAWIEKTVRGWKIHVTWGWLTHSYVDVQYTNNDARRASRQGSDTQEQTSLSSARTTRSIAPRCGS